VLVQRPRATLIDYGGMFRGLEQSIVADLLALDAGHRHRINPARGGSLRPAHDGKNNCPGQSQGFFLCAGRHTGEGADLVRGSTPGET
jgi:hypothetical protein